MLKRITETLCFLIIFVTAISASYAADKVVYSITLADEVISPVAAEYISDAIKKAEADHAECLVIQLDTPGGLLTSTREIVRNIMGAKVPVIVYVAPSGARAGSAGVFITLAANIAAMAPSTNIGAAHPVSIGEKRSLGDAIEDIAGRFSKEPAKKVEHPKEPMEDKILNDTKAWVEGIASVRGRNVGWAIKSVTESVSVSDKEALKEGVVEYVAANLNELLEMVDGREVGLPEGKVTLTTKGASVKEIPMSARRKILAIIVNPNIAYILLMLGFYGLLFEFTHPGAVFPGVAGVISLIVAFYGLHLLAANYAGVVLIVIAIILFIMEVKVISYGLLTLGGVVSLFLGSLMLFNSPYEFMRVSLPLILGVTIATLAVATFLVTMVVRTHRRRISTGFEGLIGLTGEVVAWDGKSGKIFIHGETWNAEGGKVYNVGDKVEVSGVKGMRIIVK